MNARPSSQHLSALANLLMVGQHLGKFDCLLAPVLAVDCRYPWTNIDGYRTDGKQAVSPQSVAASTHQLIAARLKDKETLESLEMFDDDQVIVNPFSESLLPIADAHEVEMISITRVDRVLHLFAAEPDEYFSTLPRSMFYLCYLLHVLTAKINELRLAHGVLPFEPGFVNYAVGCIKPWQTDEYNERDLVQHVNLLAPVTKIFEPFLPTDYARAGQWAKLTNDLGYLSEPSPGKLFNFTEQVG